MEVANRSACINQTAYDGSQLVVVMWFCSEFLISSWNIPFPSSLSSRATAYLYAPAHVFVCLCPCANIISLWHDPFPAWRLFTIHVNTTRLSCWLCANMVHLCVNTGCNLSKNVCNSGKLWSLNRPPTPLHMRIVPPLYLLRTPPPLSPVNVAPPLGTHPSPAR